jgi:hypothetical protein
VRRATEGFGTVVKIDVERRTLKRLPAGDIRDQVLALIERCAPGVLQGIV